jgi:hypothetical protein
MSQKEGSLNKLDDGRLLELARSVSKNYVDSGTSRNSLIKIVKASLSIEEIKKKVAETMNPLEKETGRDIAFTLGAMGQVFLLIYGIANYLLFFAPLYLPPVYLYSDTYVQRNAVLGTIGAVLFLIFAVLNMSSMIALRARLSGNRAGVISGSVGLIASILGMLYYLATILGVTYYNELSIILPVMYAVLIASTMVLIGVFFLLYRRRFSDGDVSMAAGIVYIFAGSTEVSILSYPVYYSAYVVNPPLFLVAGALGLACFLARRAAD